MKSRIVILAITGWLLLSMCSYSEDVVGSRRDGVGKPINTFRYARSARVWDQRAADAEAVRWKTEPSVKASVP